MWSRTGRVFRSGPAPIPTPNKRRPTAAAVTVTCQLTKQPGTSKYLRCQHVTISSKLPLIRLCRLVTICTHRSMSPYVSELGRTVGDGTRRNQQRPSSSNSQNGLDHSMELRSSRPTRVRCCRRMALTISGMVRASPVRRHFSGGPPVPLEMPCD